MAPKLVIGNDGLSSENNLLPFMNRNEAVESKLTANYMRTQADIASGTSTKLHRPPIAPQSAIALQKNQSALGRNIPGNSNKE